MKKIIIAAVICFFGIAGGVNASEDSLTVSCSDSKLTITGNGDISENEMISFVCVETVEEAEKLGDDNLPYFIEAFNADGNEIHVTLDLPEGFSGGKYYIVAKGEKFSANDYFIYIDKSKIESAIKKINSAKSPTEMGEILVKEEIDIDTEIYNLNSGLINQILYTGIGDGYDAEGFIDTLYDGYFATLICEGKSEEAFLVYCDDETLKEQYKDLEDVSEFENIFKKSDFANDDVKTASEKAFVTAKVKNADNWMEIRNGIFMSEDSEPSEKAKKFFDFTDYDKVQNKNSVFQKMAEKISEITSFYELKSVFEEKTKSVYEDENKPAKGGGSSGGGSSSGGMYSPVVNDKKDGEEKEDNSLYSDISGHWAMEDIKKLSDLGVINGYSDNTFRPDNHITRAEMIKLICEAFKLSGEGEMNFSDVSESDWHYKYINTAYVNGVANGKGDYFSPDEKITREDAAVIMYRILSKNYPLEGATLSFIDKSDISDYAEEAIGAMKNQGIIEGVGKNRFEPKSPLTRAQCAVLINRCMLRFEITE